MSATRLSLNETLGNVCHMSVFIRDIWECLSHVCPYMKHLGNVCLIDPKFRLATSYVLSVYNTDFWEEYGFGRVLF